MCIRDRANANRFYLVPDEDIKAYAKEQQEAYLASEVKYKITYMDAGLLSVACLLYTSSTNVPKLHIIFSGPVAPNPTELLSGERYMKMLDSLRALYDYIIIDAPPVSYTHLDVYKRQHHGRIETSLRDGNTDDEPGV